MFYIILRLLLPLLFIKTFSINADTCTWDTCPKWNQNLINIHLIPHTHDDLGYKKTVDQYFTGARSDILKIGVRYIFDTMITELSKNSSRKFSYCETGFLQRWMDDASDADQQKLINFVQKGQLELIGGGWVMPDEATTHYVDIIDQYTLGLRILNETFGECGHPKVNWQIDPFGHSREHANLVRLMGYDSLFFAREHYLEHNMRLQNKSLQFNWHVSEENGNSIFTGAFYNHYAVPDGFNWDILSHDEPIIDNPIFENYNVDERLNDFMTYINKRIPTQRHNHFLVLMGSDFTYQDSNSWYTNIDKLIFHLNRKFPNVTAFYSTPSCYVQAVSELKNITWPDKYDDFFPYAFKELITVNNSYWTGNHSYWTGFFTTKPTVKGLVRKSSSLLQLTRQLNSFALNLLNQTSKQIKMFERAVALSQHHDGITGTSSEFVTEDYIYRLLKGWGAAEQVINIAMNTISQNLKNNSVQLPTQYICKNINESECLFTKNNTHYIVTVHNGNSQTLTTLVKVPLYQNLNSVNITDGNGNPISSQINSVFINPGQINNTDISVNEICFVANVGPLGFQTYFLSLPTKTEFSKEEDKNVQDGTNTKSISNGLIRLDFDNAGYLSTFHDITTAQNYSITQEFAYYHGHNDSNGEQASGPYVFRPDGTTSYNFSDIVLEIVNGPLIYEARQIVAPWVSQVIRLLPNKSYVEFEWTIGPIPKSDNISKEVITRYTVNGLNSNGVFWTDSNSRQLMKRIKNHAEQYQYQNTEPIAANYYPITSRIIISDNTTSLAILTDRSHGSSSLADGQVEIMLHRRDFYYGGFGPREPLSEPGRDGRGVVVRGKHWLILGAPSDITKKHRTLAYEMFNTPLLTFAAYNFSDDQYRKNFVTQFSGLQQPLPSNINLLTLKQLDDSSVLLRLEHIYQKGEDPNLSQNVTIDLTSLFSLYNVAEIQEMSLAANNILGTLANTTITLSPMEIKTYRMKTTATSTITPTQTIVTPTQTIVMPTQTHATQGADKNIINILLMLFLCALFIV